MTDDLATWLLEQIAEDEDRDQRVIRLARAMYEAWQPNNPYSFDDQAEDVRAEYLHAAEVVVDREMLGVLAECDAKRQIVDSYQRNEARANEVRRAGEDSRSLYTVCLTLHWTMKRLALPYADRPGYREEWRP